MRLLDKNITPALRSCFDMPSKWSALTGWERERMSYGGPPESDDFWRRADVYNSGPSLPSSNASSAQEADAAAEPLTGGHPSPHERRRKRPWPLEHPGWTGIGAITGVLTLLVTVIALMRPSETSSTSPNPALSQPGSSATQSSSASGPPTALEVTTKWPWVSGCPSVGSAVAMPAGGGSIEDYHSPKDLTATLVQNGAGSWIQGSMYIHFAAAPGKRVEIVGLSPHIQRRDLAAPVWVYIEESGCGPYPGDRKFLFDLDKPLLSDEGVEASPMRKVDAPDIPLGSGFVIEDGHDAQIRLDTLSCKGNYQWAVDVQFVVDGQPGVQTYSIGPVTSFGRADNTIRYVGRQGSSGAVVIKDQQTISGGDPLYFKNECSAQG